MRKCLFVISTIFLCQGCIKKYRNTIPVCNNALYVEVYNVNPAGVDADYLTDSSSFSFYVGRKDTEHEGYNYRCDKDSIVISKLASTDFSGMWKIIEIKTYSVDDLKKNKVKSPTWKYVP